MLLEPWRLELVSDRATRQPLAPWPQTPAAVKQIAAEAKRRGLALGTRGNLIIISPPLNIKQDDLAWALDVLDELLALADDVQ